MNRLCSGSRAECSALFNCEPRAGADTRLGGLWSWEDKSGIAPKGSPASQGACPNPPCTSHLGKGMQGLLSAK